jgi:hypothetical protein
LNTVAIILSLLCANVLRTAVQQMLLLAAVVLVPHQSLLEAGEQCMSVVGYYVA